MNTEEFLFELKEATKRLYKMSDALESPFGISNSPDYKNLKEHMQVFCNISNDVLGQIKDKIKEESAKRTVYIPKKKK